MQTSCAHCLANFVHVPDLGISPQLAPAKTASVRQAQLFWQELYKSGLSPCKIHTLMAGQIDRRTLAVPWEGQPFSECGVEQQVLPWVEDCPCQSSHPWLHCQ